MVNTSKQANTQITKAIINSSVYSILHKVRLKDLTAYRKATVFSIILTLSCLKICSSVLWRMVSEMVQYNSTLQYSKLPNHSNWLNIVSFCVVMTI